MDAGWLDYDGGLALAAPVVAITTALLTRRVVASLLAGVVVAAFVAAEGSLRGAITNAWGAMVESVVEPDHLRIAAFTALVGAMVGVMQRAGLVAELVGLVTARVKGPRGAMLASWVAGMLVFFDDYANCLVVGSAMGPVCDREGVSRAKLAYIVDSTSAPVASLAVVGTWVGYEVGLIEQALEGSARAGEGFALFLTALPFRYYGWFALALVGIVAFTQRDLGPMLRAETEARRHAHERQAEPIEGHLRALLPPVVLVLVTLVWVLYTGVAALDGSLGDAPMYALLDGADPFGAMLYGAAAGFVVATALGAGAGRLDTLQWWAGTREGVEQVVEALLVLFLAWGLGTAIGQTAAREVLTAALDGRLDPAWLPATTFLVAGVTAFTTGTSFGTMSILIPLAVPLAMTLGADDPGILAATTAAVLGGAIFGDHASPISDTTVLSSAGAGVDVVTHVRTQLPYALLAGVVAVIVGHLATGFGGRPWLLLPLGVAVMTVVMLVVGRHPEAQVTTGTS